MCGLHDQGRNACPAIRSTFDPPLPSHVHPTSLGSSTQNGAKSGLKYCIHPIYIFKLPLYSGFKFRFNGFKGRMHGFGMKFGRSCFGWPGRTFKIQMRRLEMEHVSVESERGFFGLSKKGLSRLFFLFAILGVIASGGGSALADQMKVEDAYIAQRIAEAKTAQDHEAIAAYYRLQASKAGAEIKLHEKMKDSYRFNSQHAPYMKSHKRYCDSMIRAYTQIKEDDEALAEEHEQMAKELLKKQ